MTAGIVRGDVSVTYKNCPCCHVTSSSSGLCCNKCYRVHWPGMVGFQDNDGLRPNLELQECDINLGPSTAAIPAELEEGYICMSSGDAAVQLFYNHHTGHAILKATLGWVATMAQSPVNHNIVAEVLNIPCTIYMDYASCEYECEEFTCDEGGTFTCTTPAVLVSPTGFSAGGFPAPGVGVLAGCQASWPAELAISAIDCDDVCGKIGDMIDGYSPVIFPGPNCCGCYTYGYDSFSFTIDGNGTEVTFQAVTSGILSRNGIVVRNSTGDVYRSPSIWEDEPNVAVLYSGEYYYFFTLAGFTGYANGWMMLGIFNEAGRHITAICPGFRCGAGGVFYTCNSPGFADNPATEVQIQTIPVTPVECPPPECSGQCNYVAEYGDPIIWEFTEPGNYGGPSYSFTTGYKNWRIRYQRIAGGGAGGDGSPTGGGMGPGDGGGSGGRDDSVVDTFGPGGTGTGLSISISFGVAVGEGGIPNTVDANSGGDGGDSSIQTFYGITDLGTSTVTGGKGGQGSRDTPGGSAAGGIPGGSNGSPGSGDNGGNGGDFGSGYGLGAVDGVSTATNGQANTGGGGGGGGKSAGYKNAGYGGSGYVRITVTPLIWRSSGNTCGETCEPCPIIDDEFYIQNGAPASEGEHLSIACPTS